MNWFINTTGYGPSLMFDSPNGIDFLDGLTREQCEILTQKHNSVVLKMKAQETLEHLYRSEINARLQWQWDGGYDVALVAGFSNDEVIWEGNHSDLDTAVTYLGDAAARHFPNSAFKLWWEQAS